MNMFYDNTGYCAEAVKVVFKAQSILEKDRINQNHIATIFLSVGKCDIFGIKISSKRLTLVPFWCHGITTYINLIVV